MPKKILQPKITPLYLKEQRWFQNKGADITNIELVDELNITGDHSLGFFKISFSDIPAELYSVPFIKYDGEYFDVTDDKAFLPEFFKLVCRGDTNKSREGTISSDVIGEWKIDVERPAFEVCNLGSSNTLVVLNERGKPAYLLKFLRRLREGNNIEARVNTFILKETKFENSPKIRSSSTYRTKDGRRYHLTTLFNFVENDGNGWLWTTNWLKNSIKTGIKENALNMTNLGETLARLHTALAGGGSSSGFKMLKVDPFDVKTWSDALERQFDRTFGLVEGVDLTNDAVEGIKSRKKQIEEMIKDSKDVFGLLDWKIRQHGDFHLGQVLVKGDDFYIIDFEGEPLKPYNEREIHYPALKDAAGMMRSLNYAAFSVIFESKDGSAIETCQVWEREAGRAFWEGYYNALVRSNAKFLPLDDKKALDRLLKILMLEKALYEVEYEINNRPDWLSIPAGGILSLLD